MGQGSVSFPPQELEALAIFNGHEAMSAKVANSRLQLDLGVTLQKLNTATAQIETLTKERDAALAERDAARAELAAPKAPSLLPAGGVDEEPAQTPAGPQDEVALTGSMGG